MKKAIVGLAALAALSCEKPSDKLVDKTVKACDMVSYPTYAAIVKLDSPVYGKYLTFSEMASIDKALQENTTCHLYAYADTAEGDREYVVQAKFIINSLEHKRYIEIYPHPEK